MEFKIDTKDTFTIIMPLADEISANMTDALLVKWEEMRQSGSKNFIIDLQQCKKTDAASIDSFIDWHEKSYAEDISLIFTGIDKSVMQAFKTDEKDLLLNIAPTINEAIDIVGMEILARDLFNEE